MNKLRLTLLFILCFQACSETDDILENPEVWMDQGVQCSNEIEQSVYNLDHLSKDIITEITQYIDLTYGAPQFSDPVNKSQIKYMGKYYACKTAIKIWEYKCQLDVHCYIGIQPWNDSYLIGTVHPSFNLAKSINREALFYK